MGKIRERKRTTLKTNREGKIVLITGASSGLGKLTAELFARDGFTVYGGVRSKEDLEAFTPEWSSIGKLYPISLDITNEQECEAAVRKIISKEGRIDILVNNAGITIYGPTVDLTIEDYRKLLETNVVGPLRLIRLVVPTMRRQGGGRIINITSLNGLLSFPNYGLYSSSKFALEALGTALYYELAKDNIFVTNVAPGAIENPNARPVSYRTARQKFWILRVLLPMLRFEDVALKILEVAKSKKPPLRVILGRDAQITTLLNKLSIFDLWERLMFFVWNKR